VKGRGKSFDAKCAKFERKVSRRRAGTPISQFDRFKTV
jgi:hypothetical protein